MRHFSHACQTLLARCLLCIVLVTVIAPNFSWAAVEGSLPHAEAPQASMDEDCHGHADHHEAAQTGESGHRCCPGHVLGHLLGGVGGSLLLQAPPAERLAVDRADRPFSSRVPDGLERPPRRAA